MDNKERQQIEAFVHAQLPKVPEEKVKTLIEHLVGPEMELTCFDDLKYVTADMLIGIGAVQRIKLIEAFKNIGKVECSQQMPTAKVVAEPQPSTSRQADIQQIPLPDNSVFRYSIPWGMLPKSIIGKFDEAIALKQKSIHPKLRDELKLEICRDMYRKYQEHCSKHRGMQKSPGLKMYTETVDQIFQRYGDCLQDVIGNKVVGNGKGGFLHSFSISVGNLCRRQATEPPRKKGDVKLVKKGQVGVIKEAYLPEMSLAEEEQQLEIKKELLHMSNYEDWEDIVPNLHKTYALQRKEIIAATDSVLQAQPDEDEPDDARKAISNVAAEWPHLFQWRGMECHYQKLVGQPLLANLCEFVGAEMELFMGYLSCGVSTHSVQNFKTMQKFLKITPPQASHALFPFLEMLGAVFNENISLLIMSCEKTATPNDVPQLLEIPPHPCIITLGPSYEAGHMYLAIDKAIVSTISSSSEALCLLFASYFVFGCEYPDGLKFTFEVLERLVFNLELQGSKLKKKNDMAVMSARVQKLISGFNNFKEEINKP